MQTGENCDTCGRWDSGLVDGMCAECRARFNVTTAPAGHGGACCGDCNGRCARTDRDGKEAAA